MVVMCELQTRVWCFRICTMLFVFSVLMIMIVQIWNYYFSLVSEMDLILEKSPQLSSILDMCDNNITFQWNMVCTVFETEWVCHLPSTNLYIDYRASSSVIVGHNKSSVWISPTDACVKMMVWSLPW